MKTAIIILNRNLPDITNKLVEHFFEFDSQSSDDIFVLEAGSDDGNLSKYCSWHVNSKDVIKHGLRYCRGMNYALSELYKNGVYKKYDLFFLVTNDSEFEKTQSINKLAAHFEKQKLLGILSPCSRRWKELTLLEAPNSIKYFWHIHNSAYMLKREFIDSICEKEDPNYLNFLFDGTNFRGYGTEHELIAKAYLNDYGAAITSSVFIDENESYLINSFDKIKTENYEENLKLYLEEGKRWMRKKYGFSSHWSLNHYVKTFYDQFFLFHPEYIKYKI